eukprot:COSAG01_NODE_8898_length_2622_cov_1.340864_2_plen_186_part_00
MAFGAAGGGGGGAGGNARSVAMRPRSPPQASVITDLARVDVDAALRAPHPKLLGGVGRHVQQAPGAARGQRYHPCAATAVRQDTVLGRSGCRPLGTLTQSRVLWASALSAWPQAREGEEEGEGERARRAAGWHCPGALLPQELTLWQHSLDRDGCVGHELEVVARRVVGVLPVSRAPSSGSAPPM